MEKNRQDIVSQNQFVNLFDLPFILFGGDYKCQNGNTIELSNAFQTSFTVDHCRSARQKCGYCPATRCALFHPKCRRVLGDNLENMNDSVSPRSNQELVECLNNKDDETLLGCDNGENMYAKMMLNIEKMNEESCRKLQDLGYANASVLRRKLHKDNIFVAELNAHSIRTYLPGSRERQDQMTRARYPGEYFAITSGSAPNNCDDMLIAMQRSQLGKDVKQLEKKKAEIKKRQKIVREATDIMERTNDGTNKKRGPTTNAELKVCIQWKENLEKPPKGKQIELKSQWEDCKDNEFEAEEVVWTESDERQLRFTKIGEIPNFKHSKQFKIAHANKCFYIRSQAETLQKNSRLELLLSLYDKLPIEMKDSFKSKMNEIDLRIEMDYSCFSYSSDSDNDFSEDEEDNGKDYDNTTMNDEFEDPQEETESSVFESHSSFETEFIDDKEGNNDKDTQEGCCASGYHCRCPWIRGKFAHTCSECGKGVHSFCFGYNEEGGESKCALCVFPNGVCTQSLNFDPPPANQSTDVSLESAQSSDRDESNLSIILEQEESNNMESFLADKSNLEQTTSIEGEILDPSAGENPSDLFFEQQHSSSIDNNPSSSELAETTSKVNIENCDKIEGILNEITNEESIGDKRFEDMNINQLKREFAKRKMKVGRAKKKVTFIAKLNEYDKAAQSK